MTLSMCIAAVTGALTWTLLEYVIHRFLGHGKRLRKNPFAKEHIRHHIEGDYFAPTSKKALAGALACVVAGVPAVLLLGPATGAAYVVGLVGFYGVYEVVHRRLHVTAGIGPYARWARRHHFAHHFTDARFNHGVTSPLWDFVFGTYKKPGLVVVPKKLRMDWLEDPNTGAVRADWADTFILKS